MADYSLLDQPHLLQMLFYPRQDHTPPPPGAFDLAVPVDDDAVINCRFFYGRAEWPWLIYFHGNGEVASDYDGIAPFYHQASLNLAVADYRGYGSSGGSPGFANLINDSHILFNNIKSKIQTINPRTDIFVMGRSLGSTSALEICRHYQESIRGLIIESGFAAPTRLIRLFEIPVPGVDLDDLEAQILDTAKNIQCRCLIIHGSRDSLVPIAEGEFLYDALSSVEKYFELIPFADHNDIMFVRPDLYFGSIVSFVFGSKQAGIDEEKEKPLE